MNISKRLKAKKKKLIQAKISEDLHDKVHALAIKYNVSAARLIEAALEELVSK